jgi:large subunit ribosomal protein L14
MITLKTKLLISDNTGGVFGKCIQVYNNKTFASIGEIIRIVIKKKTSKKKILKNKMYPAILITIKKSFYRKNGFFIKFSKNRVLLINDQKKLLGTRYKGPIAKEILFYKKKINKIISLAKKIL